jgi:hypothetical protein
VDNLPDPAQRRVSGRFGPDRRLTALTGAAALGCLIGTLVTTDRPGRVLLGTAVVVLLGYTVTDLLFWPRITATTDGLRIKAPGGSADVAWADVDAVRADVRMRFGLRNVTLEIDAAERLHVFSKRALGSDPEAVAAMITAIDPRRPAAGPGSERGGADRDDRGDEQPDRS